MVELTELPLEWCIKITEENKDVLTKWKQTIGNKEIAGAYGSNYVNNEGLNRINSHEYTIISFEQFKKWVLKENTSQNIPEYVKYINTKYKGKIVKVEDWLNGSYCKVIFADGTREQPFKHLVEFSNKKEFDLQNNQPVFEIGKWYKDNEDNYIKYSHFIENDHYCSEWINTTTNKHYKNGGSTYVNLPEINISEIQKYLPNEHLDKIVKYQKEVVHCTNQEEWDFACNKYQKSDYVKNQFKTYNTFNIDFTGWESIEHFKRTCQNLKIYTFQDWCDKFNHVNPFVEKEKWIPKIGDWAVCMQNYSSLWYKNRVWQIGEVKEHYNNDLKCKPIENGIILGQSLLFKSGGFRKAELHEIPKNNESMNNNDLLEEAKRRYPIGTKIKHDNREYEITKELDWEGVGISHFGLPFIYNKNDNEWAEIISTPELNITNGLSSPRINHNFNESIKSNNVLLLDIVIQPIKIETISDKLTFKKETKILTLK